MKVKTLLDKSKEKAFKMDLAYKEWLRDFINASKVKKCYSIKSAFRFPLNNPYFEPLKGA